MLPVPGLLVVSVLLATEPGGADPDWPEDPPVAAQGGPGSGG